MTSYLALPSTAHTSNAWIEIWPAITLTIIPGSPGAGMSACSTAPFYPTPRIGAIKERCASSPAGLFLTDQINWGGDL